ncbi:MAG TPA: glycosyltransferase [Pyrinomonadaceae bacterium]|jgi:glycosyltransferase involved in cell wall biosynthesis
MLNVLHITTSPAGRNTIFEDLANFSDPARVRLRFGSLWPAAEMQKYLAADGRETMTLGCRARSEFPAAIVRLAQYLRQHRIDVLHTHLVEASLVGLAAAWLARTPVRVMTRHHSDEAVLYNSRRGLAADRLTANLAHTVIAISPAVKRVLVEVDGVSERKIALVPNGYDWARIKPSSADAPAAVRRELGLGDALVLCTVARLNWLKGHEYLFKALAEVELPPGARALVVGSGEEEPRLRALANELGLAERIVFTGFRRDVFDVMAAADLIVHPTLHEAQSGAIIEALNLGRPVIATAVGAADEVIIPGRTGWLVPRRDSAALAQSITEALADRARAAEYGRAGQQRVRELYPAHKMVAGYEAVYARLLAGRGAAAAA